MKAKYREKYEKTKRICHLQTWRILNAEVCLSLRDTIYSEYLNLQ